MHDLALAPEKSPRRAWDAILRGARGRCPNCGEGRLFRAYLKVADHCPSCSEALYHHRADDAPPYLTIFVVGHVIVPLALALEKFSPPPLWVHSALWLPLALIMSLAFLPVAKGGLVGLQWALYMHGFDPAGDIEDPHREAVWMEGSQR